MQTIDHQFERQRAHSAQEMHLYALVDGLLCAGATPQVMLRRSSAAIALFDGTDDESLADAGPWLLDATPAQSRHPLRRLANSDSGISWLISTTSIATLADELRDRLDVRLPDGRTALFRFYDARIAPDLSRLMDPMQRHRFFSVACNWHTEVNGTLMEIYRHA
jgi:hypothetical protein